MSVETPDEPRVGREIPPLCNLGCGEDYREGWHNVDISPAVNPDQQFDLGEPPWPLPSAHFDVVRAQHVLEHLETVPWDELARILQVGGRLEIVYPIGHTRFEDPTHRQFWNVNTAQWPSGDGKHGHEVATPLVHETETVEWHIEGHEPLAWAYAKYRELLNGVGAWLSQVPGLYGEVTVVFRHEESA